MSHPVITPPPPHQQKQQQEEADGEEALGPVKPMKDLSIAEGQKVHIALKVQLAYAPRIVHALLLSRERNRLNPR